MSSILLSQARTSLHRTTIRSVFTHQPIIPTTITPKSRLSTGKVPPKQNQNPELPSFSFKELGANRTVKIVVIVALTIGGTVESIFWAKVLWARFGPAIDDGEGEGEE